MSTLRAVPFLLDFDDIVYVRVSAKNSDGFGPASLTNTLGAKIRTEPNQMNDPVRGSGTTTTKLVIQWTALVYPDNGNSDILSYNLVWDAGTGTTN
jgi:hypothetical protein